VTGLPWRARLLILVVIAGGAALGIGWLSTTGAWGTTDLVACAGVRAATAVAERFPLEVRYRNERDLYSLADAIWIGSLLLVRPSVLALAVGAGVLLGQAAHRRQPLKIAFNVGQFMLGISAALAVFAALGAPPADEPAGWLAAAAAMAAFQVVNTVLVGLILALVERRPFRQIALPATALQHWVGNIAVGILGALVWTAEPLGLPLLIVPLALTYSAYRGWLRTVQERDWMAQMGQTADAISRSGDLTKRIHETERSDAVGHLASTFNQMLERLEASFWRERTFIRESSHELRTPITICRGHLDILGPDPDPDELLETVAIVLDELDRMTRIVDDMSDLAYMEDPASLRRRVESVDRLLAGVASKTSALVDGRLRVEPAEPGDLCADTQRLTQALINLIENAREHTPADTPIALRVVREAEAWRFEVEDHGGGLRPADEQRMFQPFVKGDQSAGSGLGLAIVSSIAGAHGGMAGVENYPDEGATFWLRIPR
jgi:signal transduction histidine kinase